MLGKHGPCQMTSFGKSIFVPTFRRIVSFLQRITKIVAHKVVKIITMGPEHKAVAYTVDFVHREKSTLCAAPSVSELG